MSSITTSTMRLSKQLSTVLRLCSRREADEWIQEGRILVNGTIPELGFKVKKGDIITVKGAEAATEAPLPAQRFKVQHVEDDGTTMDASTGLPKSFQLPRLFVAHKRSGQICDRTKQDNFFDSLDAKGVLYPRGLLLATGLDVMASGLLLLTDSSRLKTILEEHPLPQIFYLKCASRGPPDQVALRWLKSGPRLGKLRFPSISTTVLQSKFLSQENSYRTEISIAYKDARFRDIKKIFASIGLAVTDAERRKYGPFSLDRIGPGQLAELSPKVAEASLDKAIPHWKECMHPRKMDKRGRNEEPASTKSHIRNDEDAPVVDLERRWNEARRRSTLATKTDSSNSLQ